MSKRLTWLSSAVRVSLSSACVLFLTRGVLAQPAPVAGAFALASSRASLASLSAHALGPRVLPAVLAARALLQPTLCDAANAALQVFGGLGYMRDNGLEKVVRDVNCLRAFGGSPLELRLAVAGWESTHG